MPPPLTWIFHTRLETPAGRSAGLRPGVCQMAGRRRVGDRRSGGCELFGLGEVHRGLRAAVRTESSPPQSSVEETCFGHRPDAASQNWQALSDPLESGRPSIAFDNQRKVLANLRHRTSGWRKCGSPLRAFPCCPRQTTSPALSTSALAPAGKAIAQSGPVGPGCCLRRCIAG